MTAPAARDAQGGPVIAPEALLAATEAYQEARLRGIPPELAARAGNAAFSRVMQNL